MKRVEYSLKNPQGYMTLLVLPQLFQELLPLPNIIPPPLFHHLDLLLDARELVRVSCLLDDQRNVKQNLLRL